MAFFFAVVIALRLAQSLPGVGGLFHGFLGFWLVAIAMAWALSRLSSRWEARRKLASALTSLGYVDSAHNRGKRGVLLLAAGRTAEAAVDLEAALAGEPDSAEWGYRLGLARLALGRPREAIEALSAAEASAPSHGYGGIQLALARAELARGEPRRALEALQRHDQLHGDDPQAAYLRGKALARKGDGEAARRSFAEVEQLYKSAPAFRRRLASSWLWRARLARVGVVL